MLGTGWHAATSTREMTASLYDWIWPLADSPLLDSRAGKRTSSPWRCRRPLSTHCGRSMLAYHPVMIERQAVAIFLIAALLHCGGCNQSTASSRHSDENASELAQCSATGGSLRRVGSAQVNACVHYYADRGKPCNDKRECEGECRAIDDTRGRADDLLSWVTPRSPSGQNAGRCQWTDEKVGCRATVVRGQVQPGLCID